MDPWMLFAESLRSKGGVENRAGVLDAERFDLFRGKDFVRWVKANPSKCTAVAAGWSLRAVVTRRATAMCFALPSPLHQLCSVSCWLPECRQGC
jgi:hypothetical protein